MSSVTEVRLSTFSPQEQAEFSECEAELVALKAKDRAIKEYLEQLQEYKELAIRIIEELNAASPRFEHLLKKRTNPV